MNTTNMKELNDLVARAKQFLMDAEVLLRNGGFDSTVSRCYYAMFLTAEAVLLTKGLRADSHKGVIYLFGQHFVKKGLLKSELGEALNEAHDARLGSDYGRRRAANENEAKESIKQARLFMEETEKFLKSRTESTGTNEDGKQRMRGKADKRA